MIRQNNWRLPSIGNDRHAQALRRPNKASHLLLQRSIVGLSLGEAATQEGNRQNRLRRNVLARLPYKVILQLEGHNAKAALKTAVNLKEKLLPRIHVINPHLLANILLQGLEALELFWRRVIVRSPHIRLALSLVPSDNLACIAAFSKQGNLSALKGFRHLSIVRNYRLQKASRSQVCLQVLEQSWKLELAEGFSTFLGRGLAKRVDIEAKKLHRWIPNMRLLGRE